MIERRSFLFRARGRAIALGKRTAVMGIVNMTPDSFSGDGQLRHKACVGASLARARRMIRAGADIIDIGGESTRPGACAVSAREESRRVIPLIEALAATGTDVMISVDTSKAEVARNALKAGAHIVNIVQGNRLSSALLGAVQRYDAGVIVMHMRGVPRTMQSMTRYQRFLPEVLAELKESVQKTLQAGIKRSNIIVDPGLGFAKTAEQNFCIINKLERFKALGFPVLIGPSRKSFIARAIGGEPAPAGRLIGTVAAVTAGVLQGAHIVRVHDCFEVKQALAIADAILSGGK